MYLSEGMLVRSKAGRDKNRIYVVIKTEGDYVYVADGDQRPIRHMKRKNRRHLQPILKMRAEYRQDDSYIKTILEKYTRQGKGLKAEYSAAMQED